MRCCNTNVWRHCDSLGTRLLRGVVSSDVAVVSSDFPALGGVRVAGESGKVPCDSHGDFLCRVCHTCFSALDRTPNPQSEPAVIVRHRIVKPAVLILQCETALRWVACIALDFDPQLTAAGDRIGNLRVRVPTIGFLGILDLGFRLDRTLAIFEADPKANSNNLHCAALSSSDCDIDGCILSSDDLSLIARGFQIECADCNCAKIDHRTAVCLVLLRLIVSVIVSVGMCVTVIIDWLCRRGCWFLGRVAACDERSKSE